MYKKSLLLAVVLGSFSLQAVLLPPPKYFTGLPPGDYAKSCRNIQIRLEGEGHNQKRIITAECQGLAGNWKQSTITLWVKNFARSDFTLHNVDGTLEAKREEQFKPLVRSQSKYLKGISRQVFNKVK